MSLYELAVPVAEIWPRLNNLVDKDCFLIEHEQYYLPNKPIVPLLVSSVRDEIGACRVVISNRLNPAQVWLNSNPLDGESLRNFAEHLEAPIIHLNDAIRLAPVHIPKPWGQEIWFTGIEERGLSQVSDGKYQMPLPWLLALGRKFLLQEGGGEPNLLKILDPLNEEVFGDLYFELHEEKREVYVVTGIDQDAWPDGEGAIRYGFAQEKRREAESDAAFREHYLEAVRQYELIRRKVDAILDRIRQSKGIGLSEPVSAATLKSWLQKVPCVLLEQESSARKAMNEYTQLHKLALGDVVKVACLTPHALQHGVRTVEFQTPVYERKILNFAQKVLTQNHWDTEDAVAIMNLDSELQEDMAILHSDDAYCLEQVVKFDDFQAMRLTLEPGSSYSLEAGDHYKIVMNIQGVVRIGSQMLEPEEAVLVPRTATGCLISNPGLVKAVCLLSLPRTGSSDC